jgi:hypothetical protein
MRVRSRNCHDQPGGTISRRLFSLCKQLEVAGAESAAPLFIMTVLSQLTLNDRADSRLTLQIRIAEFVSTTKSEQEHAWSGN